MTVPPLTGGCLCGGVRFEVTEPLVVASYCHCTRCQRRTGTAASAKARVAPGSFRIIAGEELGSARGRPTTAAGEGRSARDCGSALCGRDPDDADPIGVRMGAFDGDPVIRPRVRQFVAYAAGWEPIPDDGLPRTRSGVRVGRTCAIGLGPG